MKLRHWASCFLLCFAAFCAVPAHAHVGSKDVFEDVSAGPYKLYATIRPPTVIPGVAVVEVRASGPSIDNIEATPTPMTGEGAEHPPTADVLTRSKDDPNFYTGNLWLMTNGSWEIRLKVQGAGGEQRVAIPVAAVALTTLKMQRGMAVVLLLLGIFLVTGLAGMIGSAVREARLPAGETPDPRQRRRAVAATVVSLLVIGLIVWRADAWWNVDAAAASLKLYQPLALQPVLHGNSLQLKVGAPGETDSNDHQQTRTNHDFIPDHGKMMHLYAIREPEMDVAFHLHPTLRGSEFDMDLPEMPAGHYALYGDVVHANGFPETLVAKLDVPVGMKGTPLAADDALGKPTPLSAGLLGNRYHLPDDYSMVWDAPLSLRASTGYALRFRILDSKGKDAGDVQPYLGMAGHAAFVKTDDTVFAHVHPEGSAAMAAMMLANGNSDAGMADMGDMPGMAMPQQHLSNSVEFPYGFPSPGRYRIFVQMKHGEIVETAAFDAVVH
jgi:hypothetical protein